MARHKNEEETVEVEPHSPDMAALILRVEELEKRLAALEELAKQFRR